VATTDKAKWLAYCANLIETHDVGDQSVVLASKMFHHNNLAVRLIRDDCWLGWRIDVLRINDKSTHDMWGMFDFGLFTEAEVRAKFESIRL
jgi:hypothetical protein